MPELNLFKADSIDEFLRRHIRRPHATHGLLRALAQLHQGEQTEQTVEQAQKWLRDHSYLSTKEVFNHLIEIVEPRIVIDKSPATVMNPRYLARMYEMFPNASFLHLTRHPRATGKSVISFLSRNSEWGGTFDVNQVDPEHIWQHTHTNIMELAEQLPEGQCMRIKGEEFLNNLDIYLPQICEWLGVRTDEQALAAMMHPEASPYACIGPSNAGYGNDPNFLENPKLRLSRVKEPSLKGELEWAPGTVFSPQIAKLAKQFGYQ